MGFVFNQISTLLIGAMQLSAVQRWSLHPSDFLANSPHCLSAPTISMLLFFFFKFLKSITLTPNSGARYQLSQCLSCFPPSWVQEFLLDRSLLRCHLLTETVLNHQPKVALDALFFPSPGFVSFLFLKHYLIISCILLFLLLFCYLPLPIKI